MPTTPMSRPVNTLHRVTTFDIGHLRLVDITAKDRGRERQIQRQTERVTEAQEQKVDAHNTQHNTQYTTHTMHKTHKKCV